MDQDFWHRKWASNEIGFHEARPNALLVAHLPELALPAGARLFLPLCGKSLDIGWLLAQGHRVAGAELSRLAIEQLFAELGVEPTISAAGPLERFEAGPLTVFVGDIFELDRATLGPVDAIYDRAALVALPDGLRARYAHHLVALTGAAPQLLVTFEYDQSVMPGPPFSVDAEEVRRRYEATYALALAAAREVPGGLKGICPAREAVWRLTPRG